MSLLVSSGGGGPITASDITDSSASGRTVLTGTAAEGRSALGIATDVGGSEPAGFYVDSVNGDDTNSGRTPGAPFKTLAKLKLASPQDGAKIYLACGSVFYEGVDLGSIDGAIVCAYGSGPAPIIDASTKILASAWTLESGHVWKTTINLGTFGWTSGNQAGVWDDSATGTQTTHLRKRTSVANVEANPGSFYAVNTNGNTYTIYVQTWATTQPTDNQIAIATSEHALFLGGTAHVKGIVTKRNLHNDGSLVVGRCSLVEDCEMLDGSKHNFLLASGTMTRCRAEYQGYMSDYDTSTSVGVFYFNGAGTCDIAIYDCRFSYGKAVDNSFAWSPDSNQAAIVCHADGGGSFNKVTANDNKFENFALVWSVGLNDAAYTKNNHYHNCMSIFSGAGWKAFSCGNKHTNQSTVDSWSQYVLNTGSHLESVDDMFQGGSPYSKGSIWLNGTSIVCAVVNGRFIQDGTTGCYGILAATSAAGSLRVAGCKFDGVRQPCVIGTSANWTLDFHDNEYPNGARFTVNGTDYDAFAGWRAIVGDARSRVLCATAGTIKDVGFTDTIAAGAAFTKNITFPGETRYLAYIVSKHDTDTYSDENWDMKVVATNTAGTIKLVLRNMTGAPASTWYKCRITAIDIPYVY